jgi:hypothetical protein
MSIVFLIAALSGLLAGMSLVKVAEQRRLRKCLVAYRVWFPRGLKTEAVQSFLGGLSGLLQPWWKRWLTAPYVVLEVHASRSGITHYLLMPRSSAHVVENLLQASLPSVRYEPVDLPFEVLTVGAEYRLSGTGRALRVDAVGANAKLLASLQPLTDDNGIVVQWLLTPHGPVAPAGASPNGHGVPLLRDDRPTDNEAVTALRAKQAHPLLLGTPRIGVASADVQQARRLLRQVEVAWHEGRAPGVHLRRRAVSPATVAKKMIERRIPFAAWPGVFNTEELSGLIGWPVETVAVPGLVLGGCRLVPASPLVPRSGTVVADSLFPGDVRPLALDEQARLRHLHVLGPTGTGKSTLLVNMAVQDMTAGRGLVLLDPKGDLVEAVLERVPDHRRNDVVVLDPADSERPIGLNPLRAIDNNHTEVVVENLVGLFKSLYRDSWGPRLDDILRAALLTLAGSGQATLTEVPLILTDPTYRRRLVGRLDDPVGLESFWGWFEALSDAERLVAIGPVLNKVRAFTMRPRVRSIIGQEKPALDMREVLRSGKVLLVSLATGLLGEEAASLLGALVVAELWHATLARARQPSGNRRAVMAYLDEWQHFVHLPTPMAQVLAESRSLGLGMALAHQEMHQLPDGAKFAVLANARSRVVFQLPAGDARLIEQELGGIFTADDLQGLGSFEVVTQLFAGGATQPPATGRTRPLPPACSDPGEVRARSRARYGVDRNEIEAAIRARQSSGSRGQIGRQGKSWRPS